MTDTKKHDTTEAIAAAKPEPQADKPPLQTAPEPKPSPLKQDTSSDAGTPVKVTVTPPPLPKQERPESEKKPEQATETPSVPDKKNVQVARSESKPVGIFERVVRATDAYASKANTYMAAAGTVLLAAMGNPLPALVAGGMTVIAAVMRGSGWKEAMKNPLSELASAATAIGTVATIATTAALGFVPSMAAAIGVSAIGTAINSLTSSPLKEARAAHTQQRQAEAAPTR
jgi:hypothetical protein